ncbi:MAG: GFA family protein [Terriglobia bacterium]
MKVTGRCHCGRIGFEAEIDPAAVRICHCTDCQTLSGSAFRVNVATLPGSFRLTAGTPKTYVKTTADSGNPRVQAFCPKCGSPIYSTTPGDGPQASYIVRVGILRQRDQFVPKKQIWFRSARPWVTHLDEIPQNQMQT